MVSLSQLVTVFARIGLLSFGGPAAQIALMHRELVEQRPWLSEAQFLRALSFCMLLPGPEAMQLATYCGWRLRGIPGGLIAGGLFILPGAIVIGTLAWVYLRFGELPIVKAMFLGVQATVLVVVAQAIFRLAGKALTAQRDRIIAVAGFIALFLFSLPFPLVIAAAALAGALGTPSAPPETQKAHPLPKLGPSLRNAAGFALVWVLPLAIAAFVGAEFLLTIGIFFSKLAVVTFGGAYAVLAYMTQEIVQTHGWLSTGQMIDALGLAETTPGPLILVTQFAAHLAGASHGATLLAGLMALWVTFVPCFLWIFAGAPLIDWLEHQPRLSAALHGITAAVVGVIANLSVWFALHVLFASLNEMNFGLFSLLLPEISSLRPLALALALIAALLMMWRRWPLPLVLVATAAASALTTLVF